MRKFIIQLSLFSFLFIIILGGISFYNRKQMKKAIIEKSKLPADTRVLILGDSHTQYALDPLSFPAMVNQSLSGEATFYSYAKAKYFLDNNPQIKLVVLSFAPFRYGWWSESFILGKGRETSFPLFFPLVAQYPTFISKIVERGMSKIFLTHYCISELGIPSKRNFNDVFLSNNPFPFLGYFNGRSESIIHQSNLTKRIEGQYENFSMDNPQQFISRFELDNLYEMVEYINSKNVQVLLYSTPCHASYNERVPSFMIHFSDSIACELKSKYGVEYINHTNYPLPDSLFYDYDHLNRKGAAIITPMLRDAIYKNFPEIKY